MLGFTWEGLELQIRKSSKVTKMEISIFSNSCYRSCLMTWKASICCLEWIWSKKLMLLAQVLRIRSSCGKMHFLEILRYDFEFEGFLDDGDDPNSFRASFVSDLSIHLVHLVKVSWNGMICSFWWFLMDFVKWFCFGLAFKCLWWFDHLQITILDVFRKWSRLGAWWLWDWLLKGLIFASFKFGSHMLLVFGLVIDLGRVLALFFSELCDVLSALEVSLL